MHIIPAKAEDFETVRRITEETIRTVYPHYYPAGAVAFFLAHHNAAAIKRDIRENCVFLIVSDSGKFTGTVTVNGNEIGRLFVLPQYQGNGFGRALLSFAESLIAEQRDTSELDVSFPAKQIYLKRGYQAVSWHCIETENGDYLCFDHMTKHLRNHSIGGETHDT
ncbi:MAG: GNAT family N-acetyltransferase [Oscillospiraceae bacterium]|nr:GNAT family N-acetyltransferase [Oscillospiraceae bacterium]